MQGGEFSSLEIGLTLVKLIYIARSVLIYIARLGQIIDAV